VIQCKYVVFHCSLLQYLYIYQLVIIVGDIFCRLNLFKDIRIVGGDRKIARAVIESTA